MRREICVALFLCLLLAVSFINISYLNQISSELISLIDEAEAMAKDNKFTEAVNALDSAIEIWQKNDLYAGILLRHSDTDNLYDCFYDVKEKLLDEDTEAMPALCSKLKYHINSIAKMEQIRLGSIL